MKRFWLKKKWIKESSNRANFLWVKWIYRNFTLYRLHIFAIATHISSALHYLSMNCRLSSFSRVQGIDVHPKIYNHPRAENNFFMFHSFSPTTSSYSINFFDIENFLLRFSLLPHWKNFQYFRHDVLPAARRISWIQTMRFSIIYFQRKRRKAE